MLSTGTSSSTSSSPGIAPSTFLIAAMTLGNAERSCNATRLLTGWTNNLRRSSRRSAKNSAIGFMSNGVAPNESRQAGSATSSIWIWQLGHQATTRDAPGRHRRSIVLNDTRPAVLASPRLNCWMPQHTALPPMTS